MRRDWNDRDKTSRSFMIIFFLLAVFLTSDSYAFTLNVVDGDGNPIPVGFRWLLEQDNTNQKRPGTVVNNSIGVDVHKSHAPVVATGSAGGSGISVQAPNARTPYFVSVLPNSDYTMGGAPVAAGQTTVTVTVHKLPIPTAQISILVFEDHNTINNVFDAGERRLSGFTILISDFGGAVSQDAFGNPLGTTYDANGAVITLGDGIITTDANGEALIKYIPPGKYAIRAIPPTGSSWVQTATIEGTPTVDAWVKANEPPRFFEGFGTGFYHIFLGFVDPNGLPWVGSGPGGSTLSGRNVFNHFSRPPTLQGFFPGAPVDSCWVGLNDPVTQQGLIAVPCDANSNFTIPGVPPGTYQLVTWDRPLDALFGFNTVTVPPGGGPVSLGNVLSFRWFGTLEGKVFYDTVANGFRNEGEPGIPNVPVNIRFRDGSIYQSTVTDPSGEYSLSEVFPFFKWLVVEVDFARFKATGMTAVVDNGGEVLPHNGWDWPSFDKLHPQPQATVNPNTGNNLSRTETGPVLTQAMHLFLNQTNVIDWGKRDYLPGENGGISGIVYYATTRAEDDPRYAGAEPWEPGIPRVQVNLYQDFNNDRIPDGRPIATTLTDSWDDNRPSRCIQTLPVIGRRRVKECFDNFGTWNQVRPGVFDGGYAFGPNLPPGNYIVEVVVPPGYILVKEEDKNVDFGDSYTPGPLLFPAECVGESRVVPAELILFPGIPAPFAGETRPLCDRKQVLVADGQNTAADFFLYTLVPKAARVVGFSNNDLAAEFDPNSPIFGEKSSPAWIPVSYQDWTGHQISRNYTDQFGSYNALLPSTYTMNVAAPSGVSPNMVTIVLNHPFLPNGTIDPMYDPNYAVVPWTFQFMPGTTTYTDTPIVPVAAFVGFPRGKTDLEPAAMTPVISSVMGPEGGPIAVNAGDLITLTSAGVVQVPNPDFNATLRITRRNSVTIRRDFSFGRTQGTVTVGGVPLNIVSWDPNTVTATVPAGLQTGQLVLTRGDNGRATEIGVTFHMVAPAAVRHHVISGQSIQTAIDNASPGDIVVVHPGVYRENVILYKNVILQGSGAGASMSDPNATIIYANPSPAERLVLWHDKVRSIRGGNDPFRANEAPGIMVFGDAPGFEFSLTPGAIQGGAIYVYNGADSLKVSNNRIRGNQGSYGGGITVGEPEVGLPLINTRVTVEYNRITGNGGRFGAGGVTFASGSDNYVLRNNIIKGNLSRWNGGGVTHYGLSDGGIIEGNTIAFNEVFVGLAIGGDGGGIYIRGQLPNTAAALGVGAGNVTINRNLIQGNLAGAGSGGGIRASWVNGEDVEDTAYALNIFNNIVVNNVATHAGGGISLQDVANANIIHNTIANNDSTSTAASAFVPGVLDSIPQGAGVVGNAHSAILAGATGQTFSNPVLLNNIIWHNRSFYNDHTLNGGAGGLAPASLHPTANGPDYWDLAVTGVAGQMDPRFCILTDRTGYDASNLSTDPIFFVEYFNLIQTATVLDEGGNAITVRFTPVKPSGNYHLQATSPAIDAGEAALPPLLDELGFDYDTEPRPSGLGTDIGADEYIPAG